MKKNSLIATYLLLVISATHRTHITHAQTGPVYYYDNTPEYKKSPPGYLTAFANYYFSFNGYGLTYALGDAGRNIQLKELLVIKTRVITMRNEINNELAIYQRHDAPYRRSSICKAIAQLGIATGCLVSSFHHCLKIDPHHPQNEDYVVPSITGITALGFIPFGINNIVKAQPAIQAHKLAHTLKEMDAVIELIDGIIAERTENNQSLDQQPQI